jgi:hypothetical protein
MEHPSDAWNPHARRLTEDPRWDLLECMENGAANLDDLAGWDVCVTDELRTLAAARADEYASVVDVSGLVTQAVADGCDSSPECVEVRLQAISNPWLTSDQIVALAGGCELDDTIALLMLNPLNKHPVVEAAIRRDIGLFREIVDWLYVALGEGALARMVVEYAHES